MKQRPKTSSRIIHNLFHLSWGAHHPSCQHYDNHLIRILDKNYCIGCTFISIGFSAGIALIILTQLKNLSPIILWTIGFLFYVPALIQINFKPVKRIKIILRFILGVSVAFFLVAMIYIQWNILGFVLKFIYIIIFYLTVKVTLNYRAKRIDNPCHNCKNGTYPFCKENVIKMKFILKNSINFKSDEDEQLLKILTSLVSQFEGKEQEIVLFDSDFQ
ncbi:MAG: hypothetical protein ACFFAJ_10555 [Candidatus Hodarchaeota archaeon]